MKKLKVSVAGKEFIVSIAETERQKEIGLQGRETLPKDEGMLFVFDTPEEVSIWMKDTLIPLDIIFINSELDVIAVYKGTPESEELMTEPNTAFVLELNIDSGIKKGDELLFSPNSKVKTDKMVVLNEDGTPQMELEGGERIFSRPNTKILIKFAKKAAATKKDSDYKALGKRVFKFLTVQDENEPEYVSTKNN